jgi:uncharacterized cupin superfamily protein
VVEGELPPGGGFQVPHWDEHLDEVFYVLEGEIESLLDGQWRRVAAGGTVFVPAGSVHASRNASDRPARQLVVGPAEIAELISELGDFPRDRWEEIHERHRSHYAKAQPSQEWSDQPWVPRPANDRQVQKYRVDRRAGLRRRGALALPFASSAARRDVAPLVAWVDETEDLQFIRAGRRLA